MKILSSIDILERLDRGWGIKSAFSYVQSLLRGTDWPDVEGQQITGFDDANLTIDSDGLVTIAPDWMIPVMVTPPTVGTPDYIQLYGKDNAGSIELHCLFPDNTDKTIATDV